MAVVPIFTGSSAGSGNGESLHTAFLHVNANEASLQAEVTAALSAAANAAADAAAATTIANNAAVASTVTSALAAKAPINNPTFTGTVTLPSTTSGLTKANVQLNNVDNTSDNLKPVSVDQAAAIAANTAAKLDFNDLFLDFVATGLVTTITSGFNASTAAGVAYINGKRVVIAAPTPRTYASNTTTFIDLSNSGTFNYTVSGTTTSGHLRLASVTTNGSNITTITNLTTILSKGLPALLSNTGNSYIHPISGQQIDFVDEALASDLTGVHAAPGSFNKPIFNELESSFLMETSMFEYMAEILRGMGGSGILNARSYLAAGTEGYHKPGDTSYAPLNIHDHPNYQNLCGMAEYSAIVNGYYLRTRHNDYMTVERGASGTTWDTTQSVTLPAVPSTVTSLGAAAGAAGSPANVAAQIAEMQQYFKAFNDKNTALRDYKTFFKWNLTYLEMWLEELSGESLDAFTSERHQIDATDNRNLLEQNLKFNYGGHKNRAENLSFFANVIRFVDANGTPRFARIGYRMLVKDLGDVQGTGFDYHPNTICRLRTNDEQARARFGDVTKTHKAARFRLDPTSGAHTITAPELLDTFMESIAGFDGYGATALQEDYTNNGTVDIITDYNTSTPKNSTKYSRFFSMTDADAAGRTGAMRGFNDPSLWVARTRKTKVMAIGADNSGEPYRFTYAIPIELVLRTPLQTWNPYNVPSKLKTDLVQENSDINSSGAKIYTGYNISEYFHITPAGFYTGMPEFDAANTDSSSIKIVSDIVTAAELGVPTGTQYPEAVNATTLGFVRNSGTYVIMPPIVVGAETINLRMRYPVYPRFNDATFAGGETSALLKRMNMFANSNTQYYMVFGIQTPMTIPCAINTNNLTGLSASAGIITMPTDTIGHYEIVANFEFVASDGVIVDASYKKLFMEKSTDGGTTWARILGSGTSDSQHTHDPSESVNCAIRARITASSLSGYKIRFRAQNGHASETTSGYFDLQIKKI